ncbi:hypothetical protein KDJ56_07700 [Brevibacillus composti]|uniref:Uncharacterized protein n=1 Tax=Brevibacillus composti TaxID=2796470 RepID=A0A7T5ENH2_9BACL|nr:hypothetical protein [Brevibacillus composti]QQE75806.1 hypothetical protein JD108_08020 [Brevibacillus composti]QUO42832.1 hypothetical protein KDJ56_07700 [Brevibacillus composti]
MKQHQDPILLRREMIRLESALAKLREQLSEIQKHCSHEFEETPLSRTCQKCLWTESLYY